MCDHIWHRNTITTWYLELVDLLSSTKKILLLHKFLASHDTVTRTFRQDTHTSECMSSWSIENQKFPPPPVSPRGVPPPTCESHAPPYKSCVAARPTTLQSLFSLPAAPSCASSRFSLIFCFKPSKIMEDNNFVTFHLSHVRN